MRALSGILLGAALTLALGSLVACDSASPVAPPGTVLTLSANPTRIASDGQSQVRVTAYRPNGTPVNEGTAILLSTTVGTIPGSVVTDRAGEAIALLRGNGDFGTATVTASLGGAESTTVEIQVGLSAGSITLQATPASVAETGGRVNLIATVRDDQGRALGGATVNFSTDVGQLDSEGGLVLTDSGGAARDVLRVVSADIDPIQGDNFQVQAEVGTGTGSLLSDSTTITIQRLPRADFTFGTNNLTVVFTDTSTGRPTRWQWDFGDGNTSTLQNPTHAYSAPGTYVVTLIASNSQGSDTISKFVSVSGQ
ncbi:MAG TPA: PKD domain-containing protein [Thermoanaerobaculia bacterium]|nr:PKD domain-containing protein [Thermoanaerobaculia bacterium]